MRGETDHTYDIVDPVWVLRQLGTHVGDVLQFEDEHAPVGVARCRIGNRPAQLCFGGWYSKMKTAA